MEKQTILILASNPRGDLRVDREIKDLKGIIRRSKNAHRFIVEDCLAVFPSELQELFDRNNPYLVHFCGHGAGKEGLMFESDKFGEQLVRNQALSGLFKLCGKNVECVLLNACTTEIQADEIGKYVPYVIGTSREILDRAARLFSIGFYIALGNGESIGICFERGFNAIQLELPHMEVVSEMSDTYRKAKVIGQGEPKNIKPLKIILKRNSRLSNPELSTNIPLDFVEEIHQEKIRIDYKDKLRDVLDNFGQTIIERDRPISTPEYEQRQSFLNKVQKFWIEGFRESSLKFNTAVDKNENDPSGQIFRPLDNLEVIPVNFDKSYDELKQTDIVGQISDGKTLLILGEPGSGKTIALLQLAERLIKLTQQDMRKPIPVVFNLSSWGQKQQLFEEWLIEELKDKYQVPKAWSEPWIKEQQLTLLLDGLDEVKENHRNACVRAINNFIDNHLETEIVVCSRVKDYEALVERLELSSAICIQPFSKQQLLDFLENADDSLLNLKTIIEQNREIAEFAQTPLILNMMTWTCQGWSARKCYREFRQPKDREFNLFESYIQTNLERDNIKKDKYSKKAIDWLSWLAKIMVSESKIIFLIEELQPTLLESTGQKISYRISNIILGGLIVFLIVGLSWGLLDLQTGLVFGLSAGFSGGIIGFGLLKEITLFEQISFKWLLSWQKTKSSMILTLILVLIFIVTFGLIQKQITDELLGLFIGVIIYTPFTFLINSVVNSKLKIEERTEPKQGILLSINNSIRLGLIGGLIGGIFWGLFVGLFVGLDKNLLEGIKYGFSAGLTSAIFTGGIVGLRYGGAAFIQHFNLSRILYRKGRIPKDYADFLNYATDIRLMKKVGGGYIFYHRMLMEHFARRKSN